MFLIGGSDICIRDGLMIHQPKLHEIRAPEIGITRYNAFIATLALTPEAIVGEEAWSVLTPEARAEITTFGLASSVPALADLFVDAFSFFVVGGVHLADGRMLFENGCVIDEGLFDELIDGIMQISCASAGRQDERPPKNKKARAIWEKMKAGRKQKQHVSKKEARNMELPNLISAVAAKSHSYNLLNIWELTVWQLYNQFSRIATNNQTDVVSLRWAAWGEDDFDFSIWYRNQKNDTDGV